MEAHEIGASGIAWRLGATLFFVLLNGFFVAAEFALVKVRASRIDALAREGSRQAATVQHLLAHLDRYLSACQLGITLASLILGALGEPAVSVLIMAGLKAVGIEVARDAGWLPIVSIGVAFMVITMLHMTVGEQAPKMWALRRAEGTAMSLGLILRVFTFVFGPFIHVINWVSNWMLRVAGLPADSGHEATHTAEEIRSILSLSAEAGHISERAVEIAENALRTMRLEVRHIVVPRLEVDFVSLQDDAETNFARIREVRHSRIPVCERGLDSIVGLIHTRDLLGAMLGGDRPDLRTLSREPLFVSDTMSLSDFLLELQAKQQHCAVVVDEHGTAMGMAFREDGLEEIVGPLGDEFDDRDHEIVRTPAGVEISGRVPLPEACDLLKIEIPSEEDEGEETIGGHVTARVGRLAEIGDVVELGGHRVVVIAVDGHRIDRLRFEGPADETEPTAE